MSADAQRFAATVLAAFDAAGRSSDTEINRAGGPSTSTMTKLRNAAKGLGSLAQPRMPTWQAIDRAASWPAGTARRVWDGAEPPAPGEARLGASRPVEESLDDLVEFTIEGNFGVKAVVKGPIRDIDALQAAVSRLVAGMQTPEADETPST